MLLFLSSSLLLCVLVSVDTKHCLCISAMDHCRHTVTQYIDAYIVKILQAEAPGVHKSPAELHVSVYRRR